MTLEAMQKWTDAELQSDLDLCLWEYKRVSGSLTNEYIAWDIHYRKLYSEYERRGMLNQWDERIKRFRDDNKPRG
jgi:hypothetical protein